MDYSTSTTTRPLSFGDAEGARALIEDTFRGTPYLDRAHEVLTLAVHGGIEHRALVVEVATAIAALAVFGAIAGAAGAARLHVIAVSPSGADVGIGPRLLEAVVVELRQTGARFVLAEMPEDPAIAMPVGLLLDAGFVQEARIPDLFRDGVALVFLRRDL